MTGINVNDQDVMICIPLISYVISISCLSPNIYLIFFQLAMSNNLFFCSMSKNDHLIVY